MREQSGAIIIKQNGEGIEQVLHRALITNAKWIFPFQEWLANKFKLKIYSSKVGGDIQISLGGLDSPERINIVDVGQGIQEMIPIACLIFSRFYNKGVNALIAIEEPESHLHPKYHEALASAFCEGARANRNTSVLIETHSENLLLKIQIELASGTLRPSDVIVYWVRQISPGISTLEPITFDSMGRPQGTWPAGVFSEDVEQARELYKIQKSREG